MGHQNASRVPDKLIEDEIGNAKAHLSDEIRSRLNTGETLEFYGNNLELALTYFVLLRLDGLGPLDGQIPSDHPKTVSHMKGTDFGSEQKNFWRDRMVRALNRI